MSYEAELHSKAGCARRTGARRVVRATMLDLCLFSLTRDATGPGRGQIGRSGRRVHGRLIETRQQRCASQQISAADVRFGSKADICGAQRHVRFTPNSDRKSGLPQRGMSALPRKRTCAVQLGMSALGQKRTLVHSMITSTRCRNRSGMLRSNAFAVLRLMTNSYFVGCSTGMSFGPLP